MQKIRVGIIGTGFGAKVHAPIMRFHDGFEVVAIASVTRRDMTDIKRISGIENVYTDWRLMLMVEDLDLIVVASAVHLHHEMVIEALKYGTHILCEKPMAQCLAETEEMIAEQNKVQTFGFINHEFRFLPARTKVKEILNSGILGPIFHIRYSGTFSNYSSLVSTQRGWLGQKETGGGMLGAIGSHMIDSLHWWFNSHFQEVFANLPIHIPVQIDKHGNSEFRTADDAFQVIGTLENGATVTMELISAARKIKNNWSLEIFAKEGTLIMLNDSQVFFSYEDEPLEEIDLAEDLTVPSTIPAYAARYYNGFQRMLNALYESLTSGNQHCLLADFENGRDTQKVLDAIRQSSKKGKRVKVEY
ncbi:Gfo/Idh/MocA family protein [Cytobacillus sp. Hz8]|uniref:Gfo/Idh/MocA family protein n=1 Tax=Cytobacillus sp. Hz8 TaxID=3347168 RepID=UPI0035D9C4EE